MSNVAIRVEGLHKQYRLGSAQQRYKTLRDSIANAALRPFRRWRNKGHQDPVDTSLFWALKDVSFEIKAGEVVGVIGRNGAGKSTLLKVLSRITEPTSGYAEIHGRVGSLLEVGTGFHPELSGRENIYLNGAILGMKRTEVERKFDEIVSFAEVEQFVDTPVKFYSSGMYLRLAFAVAAHLEPEILLVDEVLAVGDASFQKRCIGKMDEVAKVGRTVLFVSHNMGAIQSLCRTALVLSNGSVHTNADVREAVTAYLSLGSTGNSSDLLAREDRKGNGQVRLARVDILAADGSDGVLATGQYAGLRFHLDRYVSNTECSFTIYDMIGTPLTHCSTRYPSPSDRLDSSLAGDILWQCEQLTLLPGTYKLNVAIHAGGDLADHLESAVLLHVTEGAYSARLLPSKVNGRFVLDHVWQRRTPVE